MTKEARFFSKVTNGKLAEGVEASFREFLVKMEGKFVVFSFKENKKKRSQKQSRFYRGTVIPIVREVFWNDGQPITADTAHLFCKVVIGKMVDDVRAPSGEYIPRIETSVELTTEKWEQWMDLIRAWVAKWGKHGEEVPYPNENLEPPSWINETTKEYRV